MYYLLGHVLPLLDRLREKSNKKQGRERERERYDMQQSSPAGVKPATVATVLPWGSVTIPLLRHCDPSEFRKRG